MRTPVGHSLLHEGALRRGQGVGLRERGTEGGSRDGSGYPVACASVVMAG